MSLQTTLAEFTSATYADGSESDTEPNIKPYTDEDWLRERYCEQRMTAEEVANEADVSMSTVLKWMDRNDINRRSGAEAQTDADIQMLQRKGWLRKQYHQQGKTTTKIAEELGVSQRTVWNWMERHNIERRSISEIGTDGDVSSLRDSKWLREQYWSDGRNSYDIADELGVAGGTVRNWMERHNIKRRDMSEAKAEGDIIPLKKRDWLHQQYVERERSAHDIADELGVSANAVRDWADKHDIQIRSLSEANARGNVAPLWDADWLRERYQEKEMECTDIANMLGVSVVTVSSWMKKHEIEQRSLREVHANGDIAPLRDAEWLREQYWVNGQTLAEIGEELGMSQTGVSVWMERHEIEVRRSQGCLIYPDHLDHGVRSEWELTIANLLNDNNIPYQYESMSIEYGDERTYTPDFLTDRYIIEVKGRLFSEGSERQKARAAMERSSDRDYVVVGTELPADHHFPWDERDQLISLFSEEKED